MDKDILTVISRETSGFSKGQRAIAKYILEYYDKAAFMTAGKLGHAVGVSESTVVRFASELGYEGYPEMRKALQEMIRNRLTSVQRIEVTSDQIGDEDVLTKVLNMDIEKIRRTQEEVSVEEFNRAVDAIVSGKNIYIMGVRSAAALAGFLGFYFNHIFPNVRVINSNSVGEMFEQMIRIDKNDVFIALSFPRYSQRTVQAANFAHNSGAKVISITDSHMSPLVEQSDHVLFARSDMASFVDSLVAPLSLINALIVAVGLRNRTEVSKTFDKLEYIWEEYNVYEKADGQK